MFQKNCAVVSGGPSELKIDDSLAQQVAIGQDFQLNCSAVFDLGVHGDIKWTVPNPNGIDVNILPFNYTKHKEIVI